MESYLKWANPLSTQMWHFVIILSSYKIRPIPWVPEEEHQIPAISICANQMWTNSNICLSDEGNAKWKTSHRLLDMQPGSSMCFIPEVTEQWKVREDSSRVEEAEWSPNVSVMNATTHLSRSTTNAMFEFIRKLHWCPRINCSKPCSKLFTNIEDQVS